MIQQILNRLRKAEKEVDQLDGPQTDSVVTDNAGNDAILVPGRVMLNDATKGASTLDANALEGVDTVRAGRANRDVGWAGIFFGRVRLRHRLSLDSTLIDGQPSDHAHDGQTTGVAAPIGGLRRWERIRRTGSADSQEVLYSITETRPFGASLGPPTINTTGLTPDGNGQILVPTQETAHGRVVGDWVALQLDDSVAGLPAAVYACTVESVQSANALTLRVYAAANLNLAARGSGVATALSPVSAGGIVPGSINTDLAGTPYAHANAPLSPMVRVFRASADISLLPGASVSLLLSAPWLGIPAGIVEGSVVWADASNAVISLGRIGQPRIPNASGTLSAGWRIVPGSLDPDHRPESGTVGIAFGRAIAGMAAEAVAWLALMGGRAWERGAVGIGGHARTLGTAIGQDSYAGARETNVPGMRLPVPRRLMTAAAFNALPAGEAFRLGASGDGIYWVPLTIDLTVTGTYEMVCPAGVRIFVEQSGLMLLNSLGTASNITWRVEWRNGAGAWFALHSDIVTGGAGFYERAIGTPTVGTAVTGVRFTVVSPRGVAGSTGAFYVRGWFVREL